jgi:hypothetical protein
MKLDYDTIEQILLDVEEKADGIKPLVFEVEDNDVSKKYGYHLRLLISSGLIEQIGKEQRMLSGHYYLQYIGLTLSGHKLLDSMRNETIWNKIKDNAKLMGIEGLKQIPALAIDLFIK